MYQIGDQVIYGIHGVCRIVELEERVIDRKRMEYYVLMPLEQSDARSYIPTQNQAAVAKLRPVLSSGDRATLISMVATLRHQREAQAAAGRKFHLCDENFLRDAEKLLGSEISLILQIVQNKVGQYIQDKLKDA